MIHPKLKLDQSLKLYEEALDLVPGAVLGIRRPYNFIQGEYPIFFEKGKGGRVFDVDGNEYIDMLCAYGPIIIGHREQAIDDAVVEQIREKGFCFSLTQPYQNLLAQTLRELIPSAEQSLFLATGSDATTAAIRIARASTGRTKILRCGYHGWHDWCVEVHGGIPQKVYEDVHEFHFNDLEGFESLMSKYGDEVAAVIITPIGHPLGEPIEEPLPGFLEAIRSTTEKYGTVLIFDEIRTGFRVHLGGAQALYGVTPDLSVFGKAMANGYAISAVVGKKSVMKVAEKEVFISSTFFPNSLAYVAALKTIDFLKSHKVIEHINHRGGYFLANLKRAVADSGFLAQVSGIPSMAFITFPRDSEGLYKKLRTEFYTQTIRRGLFIQPFHHGYIAYRHTDDDLSQAVQIVRDSLDALKKVN